MSDSVATGWLQRAGTLGALTACLHGASARGAASVSPPARFVVLTDTAADPCADEATLKREVIARLGRDPFRDDADRTVVVSLHRDGADLAGRIELTDTSGKVLGAQEIRTRAGNCAELAAALELTLSMVLDARVAETPAPASGSETSAEANQPAGPPSSPRAELTVSLGALVAFAAAPSTVAGVSLGFEARWPSYSLALEGRVDGRSQLSLGEGSIDSFLWMVTFVPCLRHRSLGVCGLLAAGAQQAEAVGVPGGVAAGAPYLAPGLRLAVTVPLGSVFAAQLRGDLLIPVARTSFYAGPQQYWVTPPASFVAGLVLEAQISR
jgi:hypothetical protein